MKLGFFFSRGISLKKWLELGLFDREKLIYEKHLENKNFEMIYWFTYGKNDKKLSYDLKNKGLLHPNIEVIEMPKFFSNKKVGVFLYSLLIPFIHFRLFDNIDILKSNQMDGSWSALISKMLYKKIFLNRTGYTLSLFLKKRKSRKLKILLAIMVERIIYKFSDISIVASFEDKEYLEKSYNLHNSKLYVNYNYINTELFKNLNLQRKNKFIFVGRLNEQKNLFSLIEAVAQLKFSMDIYGDGDLKEKLILFANKYSDSISFKGLIDNKKLPYELNKYKYYILPSLYEGMPKTLIEAMACGCICIGTNTSGINEIIKDKNTGFLINGFDSQSIKNEILNIVNHDTDNILINSSKFIKLNFSLDMITENEFNIIKEVKKVF